MQQSDILSIAERLIPAYDSDAFENLLTQLTEGQSPAARVLVKMELNRIMSPCNKTVDLRGRVKGECRNYTLHGITHWLDDVAFNEYHKLYKKFGSYTEGVWEGLYNTRNNYRVLRERGLDATPTHSEEEQPFQTEAIHLGYDLKRKENRLAVSSQVEIGLPNGQSITGVTVDISPSGARIKAPNAYKYKLGQNISILYSELRTKTHLEELEHPIEYRILGIDEIDETDSVKYLRIRRLTQTNILRQAIELSLANDTHKIRHENQDKIVRARTRAFEHIFLKHSCQLPVFFAGDELKMVLLTESNKNIWQYWHDERNMQTLGGLFNPERMQLLAKPGVKGTDNTVYTFKHDHQQKSLFFSLMMSEGSPEIRKLFWHIGARRDSWRAFRISMFELSDEEKESIATENPQMTDYLSSLTHMALLQEIANAENAKDYLFVEKPKLASAELNPYRQPRNIRQSQISVYFDARSQRKEPRYELRSPLIATLPDAEEVNGYTIDISRRGLNIEVGQGVQLKVNDKVFIHFKELKLYNKKLNLEHVPYTVVRVAPHGKHIQMVMEENSSTLKVSQFLNKLIENNKDRLMESKEVLPSETLLESLHHILLAKVVSTPIFVERHAATLRPKVIGLNFPYERHMLLFAKLGNGEKINLEPLFKGHTNTLLAEPMKKVDNAKTQYHEVYIGVRKFGERIRSVESYLITDFESTKARIKFMEESLSLGELFVLRVSGLPVTNSTTTLLKKDLEELAGISLAHAKKIEREISHIEGYGEIIDVTDEVITCLEISH